MGDHFCHSSDMIDASFGPANTIAPVGENLPVVEDFRGGRRGGRRGGGRRWGGRGGFRRHGWGYRGWGYNWPYYSSTWYDPWYYTTPQVITVTKEVETPEPMDMTPWFFLVAVLLVVLFYKK